MKAAVLYEFNSPFSIEEVDLAPPKDDEVLVSLRASGVCGSDLTASKGLSRAFLPAILGHEASGVVESVGAAVTRVSPGDHVILSWAPNCGHCFYCEKSLPVMCDAYGAAGNAGGLWDQTSRLSKDGKSINHYSCVSSFAEKAVVPEAGCIRIDKDIPFAVAALIGCAVTTGFGAVVNDAKVGAGDAVGVIGVGGVGINALQAAVISGAATVVAIDIDPAKEAVARRFGATHFVRADAPDMADTLLDLTNRRGLDSTIECTGNPAALVSAYSSLRAGGKMVSVGIAASDSEFIISAASIPNSQRHIIGSSYGGANPEKDIRRILALYRAGKYDLDNQIGQQIALDDINSAFDALRSGVSARTVICFSS